VTADWDQRGIRFLNDTEQGALRCCVRTTGRRENCRRHLPAGDGNRFADKSQAIAESADRQSRVE
jgi:hypothetical protein